MWSTETSVLLPEYSMECHCSCHVCEESEKEEESCQVGHRGDGTKDVSVSNNIHCNNTTKPGSSV